MGKGSRDSISRVLHAIAVLHDGTGVGDLRAAVAESLGDEAGSFEHVAQTGVKQAIVLVDRIS